MSRMIRLLAAPETDNVEVKSFISRHTEAILKEVDIDILQENLCKLSEDVGELLAKAPMSEGFRLKLVTVGIEISAEGGITLIGTLTAGVKAAIELTFERA